MSFSLCYCCAAGWHSHITCLTVRILDTGWHKHRIVNVCWPAGRRIRCNRISEFLYLNIDVFHLTANGWWNCPTVETPSTRDEVSVLVGCSANYHPSWSRDTVVANQCCWEAPITWWGISVVWFMTTKWCRLMSTNVPFSYKLLLRYEYCFLHCETRNFIPGKSPSLLELKS